MNYAENIFGINEIKNIKEVLMKKAILLILVIMTCGCISSGKLKNLSEKELYDFKWSPQSTKQKYRQELVSRHPEWDSTAKSNVMAGKIEVGMTKNQVLSSVGIPTETLGRTPSEDDDHAVWIYRHKYLEFVGEKLDAIYERKEDSALSK